MRAVLIWFLLLNSVLVFGQKRLQFKKVAPLPNEAYAFAYTESGKDVFALGGGEDFTRFTSYVHIYNSEFDFWTTIPIKEIPRIKYSSAIYMEDYNGVLMMGGIQPYGSSVALVEKIRMLNLDDYSVSVLGVLPEPAKRMGMANKGNKAYFFGGSTSMNVNGLGTRSFKFSNKLFSYDMEVGHMEMLPDMPKAMETDGGIMGDNLYVFGGFNGNPLTDIWKYDLKKASWLALEPFDKPVSSYALAQYQHYFILVGDYYDYNQLIVYNTKTETAQYFKTNFEGKHMGASVIGEDLYVYGGETNIPETIIKHEHYKISIKELIKSLDQ